MPDDSDHAIPVMARVAIAALALLGHIGGWMILLAGGFKHNPLRSNTIYHVEGKPALLMAAIMFLLGTVAVAAFLQASGVSRKWYWLACIVALALPMGWLALQRA